MIELIVSVFIAALLSFAMFLLLRECRGQGGCALNKAEALEVISRLNEDATVYISVYEGTNEQADGS